MLRSIKSGFLCFLLSCFLVACSFPPFPQTLAPLPSAPSLTPTLALSPSPLALTSLLRLQREGFSLRYPRAWATRRISNTIEIAPTKEALESLTLGDQLVIKIDATPLLASPSAEQHDVQSYFRNSSLSLQRAGHMLGATLPFTVNGQAALEANLSAALTISQTSVLTPYGKLVVLLAPSQIVRILGQAAPSAWESQVTIFDKLVRSIDFFAPPPSPTPIPADHALQPLLITEGPPGFVLRVGSSEGPRNGRFVLARGLDIGPDGTVYLAERGRGVWVLGADGKLISTFGKEELLDAHDVALGPKGDVFVADYGRNAITRFRPDGTLSLRWGQTGEGPGQFGLMSPQHIAVGPDGSVYALDSHINNSIVRFNGNDGSFIERLELPPNISPNDLAVDAEGNIFIAETIGKTVLRLDPKGQIVARLGEGVMPGGITAGAIALDSRGNVYIATWGQGILKLAPNGSLLDQVGATAQPGTTPKPGEFSLPNGIAVSPNGTVWVSDNSGEYSALTALRFPSDTSGAPNPGLPSQGPTNTALLSQWAASATASSQYDTNYGPDGVTGPPDVQGCQDSNNAWASADPNGIDTLEVRFDTPVYASKINIHQNHQPGFIGKVELLDELGAYTTVYTNTTALTPECPKVLAITFQPTLHRIVGARLTIDQKGGANWTELDAVELIGMR